MKRWMFFLYGVVGHVLFLATFAYLAGFVGNFIVPKTLDSGGGGPVGAAIAIDLLLVLLFAAQHSIMARPGFKRIWTRFVPVPIERATYVYFSCAVTILLMWQWRGIDAVIWEVQQPAMRWALWGLFAAGWLLVPLASLMIDHFDLFGTRQVWLNFRNRAYEALPFRTPWMYKFVRHPLYVGWMIAFWATPVMTAGHMLFSAAMTGYILLAALVEERDLVAHFGRKYEEYRRRVPGYIPRFRRPVSTASRAAVDSEAAATEKAVGHV